jgi:hypothetical protein
MTKHHNLLRNNHSNQHYHRRQGVKESVMALEAIQEEGFDIDLIE